MEETYYANDMIFAMTCNILYIVFEEQSGEQNFYQYVVVYSQSKEPCCIDSIFLTLLKRFKIQLKKSPNIQF